MLKHLSFLLRFHNITKEFNVGKQGLKFMKNSSNFGKNDGLKK